MELRINGSGITQVMLNLSYETQKLTDFNQTEIDESWLHGVLYSIRMCFLPVVLLGTITNVFNFIILMRRDMRFLSTSVYLFALAIADTGVMYFELFRIWFEWADLIAPEIYMTPIYCKIANYTNGVMRDFANWLIACLALERVIMVVWPYKAKRFSTVRTAKKLTIGLFCVLCLPHIHSLVYSVPKIRTGGWVCWENQKDRIGVILAAIVEFAIGYVVILVVFTLNIILVSMIYRRKLPCLVISDKRRVSTNRRLTRTLLFVAMVFLICETPRMIMAFISRFQERTPTRRIILNLSYVLSGLNHASNFFIYILASPRFRMLLLRTFPFSLYTKKFKRRREPVFTYRVPYIGVQTQNTNMFRKPEPSPPENHTKNTNKLSMNELNKMSGESSIWKFKSNAV